MFDSNALESFFFNQYNGLYTRRQWETIVNMMYKRKDRKILPVNQPLPDGISPGGNLNGKLPGVTSKSQ